MSVGINDEKLLTNMCSKSEGILEKLLDGPKAAYMLNAITILSGVVPDFTLKSETSKIEKLKSPESFKASLFQVVTEMRKTFNTAHRSMNRIENYLEPLSDWMLRIVKIKIRPDNDNHKEELQMLMNRIKNNTDKCFKAAAETCNTCSSTYETIYELHRNVKVANKISIDNKRDADEKLKIAKEEKDLAEKRIKENKDNERKQREELEKAIKNHEINSRNCEGAQKYLFAFCDVIASPLYLLQPNRKSLSELQNERLRMSQENVRHIEQEMKAIEEKRRNEENARVKFMMDIENLDVRQLDLNQIIKFIERGMKELNNLQSSWESLKSFFVRFMDVVEDHIVEKTNDFIDDIIESKTLSANEFKAYGMSACGTVFIVYECARLYKRISNNYVSPIMEKALINTAMTEEEANNQFKSLKIEYEDVSYAVKDCVNDFQSEIKDNLAIEFRDKKYSL